MIIVKRNLVDKDLSVDDNFKIKSGGIEISGKVTGITTVYDNETKELQLESFSYHNKSKNEN